MRLFNFVVIWILIALATPVIATENKQVTFKHPSAKSIFVATTDEVVLTFLSQSTAYSDDLFLVGSPDKILNNQTAISGQQFSLGSFQAGTELVFRLFVTDTGYSFYNGKVKNNPDKTLHTAYEEERNHSVIVGFEDIFKGGDRDYNDMVFSLSNVVVGNKYRVTPVPEPESYALMLAGLLMLGAVKRHKH